MAELVFFRRGDEVLRCALDKKRLVLGRADSCDLVLPTPEISRVQLAITHVDSDWYIEDLSNRGTVVAGETVTSPVKIKDGSDIALGPFRAIFRESSGGGNQNPETEVGSRTEVLMKDPTTEKFQQAQVRIKQTAREVVVPLLGDSFSFGKEADNSFVIDDRYISNHHLKVTRRLGVFQVVDHHSTNGTFINNIRVFEAEVPFGTTLRVGEAFITFEPIKREKQDESFEGIIGNDPALRQLTEMIQRVAPSNAAVAVLGESGTGKELVAHAIHKRSLRAEMPFIPINCAAISKELIESELFGHEKGAFTGATAARKGAFEEASGGTIFLDEIGELPLDLQAKLLRVLESGEIKRVGSSTPHTVDVRIVAATNRDMLQQAKSGKFREDLYYRLCVVPLNLPPLRNRRSDVVALAEHFVKMFSPKHQTVKFTGGALDRLQMHHWPGNVRELRNVVHRALLLRKGPMIDASDLTFDSEMNKEVGVEVPDFVSGLTLEQMLERVERQIVESALRRFNQNKERVAKELGVARSTLFKRLKDWGLTNKDEVE